MNECKLTDEDKVSLEVIRDLKSSAMQGSDMFTKSEIDAIIEHMSTL